MNAHQSLAVAQPVRSFPPVAPDAAAPEAMVRFEAISKVYPAYRDKPSVRALQEIDFSIARGSVTGVIGRSGAGKSSLVRLINGLEKPTTGRVIVDGRDISGLAGRDLRLAQRSIGMIFQHFNLLSSRTAADNIALPLEIAGWSKTDIAVRVSELLDLVDIADKRASSTNIKCCAKQIDSKDIFILSGRLKSLSSKDNGRQSGSRINSYLIGISTRAPASHTLCNR
jgi:D-methionine transport system ATP-binding protein